VTRFTLGALLVVAAALALVGAGSRRMLRSDRAALVDEFAAERLRHVDEAAREIGRDVDDVAAAVQVGAGLVRAAGPTGDAARALELLVAAVKPLRVVRTYDAAGALRLTVGSLAGDPQASEARGAEAAFAVAVARALAAGPGRVATSATLSATGRGWYRVLATAYGGGPGGRPAGVVAALVALERVFDKLHLVAGAGAEVLLLGAAPGEPTAASGRALAETMGRLDAAAPSVPRFAAAVAGMRAGQRGTAALDEREAARLGLDPAEVIVAFTRVPGEAAGGWSVATLSSTEPLRGHERRLVRRLAMMAGAAALLLVGLGAWLVVAARRAATVREQLRHAAEVSYLSEKTEKILDNIPTGVMAISDGGTITAVNRALRERCPDAVGGDLARAFPEAPAATVARLSSLVASARAAGRVRSLRGERLALFGEEGQYMLHAVPLETRFPEARVLLVVEDVSEVRQLADQLLRAEKLATIGVLSAGIAHEIGTPLGVVRGRAEYILGKLGVGHPQAAGLGVIVEQIDRVSRTIRQLLDFARVKPAMVRAVALAPVARAVAELLRYEAERLKVELAIDVGEDLVLSADPDQLQQVLVNLVMNACDACAEGGHVRIVAARDPGAAPGGGGGEPWSRVRIEVIDDGCGIREEDRLQVFDPFFTTKKRGHGTGLGLPIAAEIVRNHGAEIELQGEPGRGTRAILLWPAAAAAAAAAMADTAREEQRGVGG
jgi:signal transduction histidine kinase